MIEGVFRLDDAPRYSCLREQTCSVAGPLLPSLVVATWVGVERLADVGRPVDPGLASGGLPRHYSAQALSAPDTRPKRTILKGFPVVSGLRDVLRN